MAGKGLDLLALFPTEERVGRSKPVRLLSTNLGKFIKNPRN
jgi:hypothetical protein